MLLMMPLHLLKVSETIKISENINLKKKAHTKTTPEFAVKKLLTFHQHSHSILQNFDSGEQNQNWENKSADGINNNPIRFEINDQCGYKYAQTL